MFPQGNVVSEPDTLADQNAWRRSCDRERRRRARLRLLLGHRAPLRRLQPRAGPADRARLRRRAVPGDGARVDGRGAAVERPAARDRAGGDARLPGRRPLAARHREGRGEREFRGFGMDLDEGRRRFEANLDLCSRRSRRGVLRARGRGGHRDPADAAQHFKRPDLHGGGSPQSLERAADTGLPLSASSCARGRRWRSRSSDTRSASRRPSGRAAALRAAHLRVLRPRPGRAAELGQRYARAYRETAVEPLRPRRQGERPAPVRGGRRSGARRTRSSRSARPPPARSAPITSSSRSVTPACRTPRRKRHAPVRERGPPRLQRLEVTA